MLTTDVASAQASFLQSFYRNVTQTRANDKPWSQQLELHFRDVHVYIFFLSSLALI